MKNKMIKLLIVTLVISTFTGCAIKKTTDSTPVESTIETSSEAISEDSNGIVAEATTETTSESESETTTEATSESESETTTEATSESESETTADTTIPTAEIDLTYVSEFAFDPENYPELSESEYPKEAIDAAKNNLADVTDEYHEGDRYIYGNCTTQTVTQKPSGQFCIVNCDVSTGDPLMDQIMNAVGYQDYYVSYRYSYGLWETDEYAINTPVRVNLQIGDANYEYVFLNNYFVLRKSGNDEQYNPQFNDFIQNVFRLGCYYGEVLNTEKGRYNLFITSPDNQIYESDEKMIFEVQIQGMDPVFTFVLDENTTFSEDCETSFFEGYESGDTPLSWALRAKANAEDMPTALTGIFDVKVTGNHIDSLCGCYWWD